MSIASQPLERFPVLGIPVDLHDNYSHWLTERLEDRIGTHVVTLNSEMVMLARQDQTVAALIRQGDKPAVYSFSPKLDNHSDTSYCT